MEHNDPSRRQYAQNPYATPQQVQTSDGSFRSRFTQQSVTQPAQSTPDYTTTPQNPPSGPASGSNQFNASASFGRFRVMEQSPNSLPGAGRVSSDGGVYGFAQTTQYGSAYSVPAQALHYGNPPQRPQDASQYAQQYGPNVLYNMAPPPAHPAPQATYEQVPQQQRSSGGSEAFPTPAQFGSQQGAFYLSGQPVGAGPSSGLPAQQLSYEPAAYSTSNAPGQMVYGASAMDTAPQGVYTPYGVPSQYNTSTNSVDHTVLNSDQYQSRLRSIFSDVNRGSLRAVEDQLLQVSTYLLGNIEQLRLHLDHEDPNDEQNRRMREERVEHWDAFNRAWLTTMQRQFDLTQEMMATRQPLSDPQSILDTRALERMAGELIRLCDGIERYGLVDYQSGVAEEEIIDLIMRCLSLLNPSPTSSAGVSESSAAGTSRGQSRPQ